MAGRKPPLSLLERTPLAEWIAAAAGLILTLLVVTYTLWEGVVADHGPPRLSVTTAPAVRAGDGFVLPVTVRNASHATAAEVEVRGVLTALGGPPEERRASFAYVPGRGEAHGGLLFRSSPATSRVEVTVEGFANP